MTSNQKLSRLYSITFLISLISSLSLRYGNASDKIITPYQSTRSATMGRVLLTTGEYEENFNGNPARTATDKKWKVTTPLNMTFEGNATDIDAVSSIDTSDILGTLGNLRGKTFGMRFQMAFPAVFVPDAFYVKGNPISIAVGALTSVQSGPVIRRNFSLGLDTVGDVGAHFVVAGRFLPMEQLRIGLDTHVDHRFSTPRGITFAELFKGFKVSNIAGEGSQIDFNLGSTYTLPWTFEDLTDVEVGASLNNILGGKYSNLSTPKISDELGSPLQQPQTLGLGISIKRPYLWAFDNPTWSLEFQNILYGGGGSIFRHIHTGGEIYLGPLGFRTGISQGYLCGGLGLKTNHFRLNLGTYGEELTLNAGGLENRIYALNLALDI